MRRYLLPLCLLAAAPVVAFGQSTTTSVSVENVWARATSGSAKTGAIYLTIVDHGAPDRLVAASTPAAEKAELHETIHEGTVMKMRPVDGLAVAQGKPVTFAPGGYHVMLINLTRPLQAGQSFPLTLTFQNAGPVETSVLVKAAGAGGDMQMGGSGQGMGMDMPMGGSGQGMGMDMPMRSPPKP